MTLREAFPGEFERAAKRPSRIRCEQYVGLSGHWAVYWRGLRGNGATLREALGEMILDARKQRDRRNRKAARETPEARRMEKIGAAWDEYCRMWRPDFCYIHSQSCPKHGDCAGCLDDAKRFAAWMREDKVPWWRRVWRALHGNQKSK